MGEGKGKQRYDGSCCVSDTGPGPEMSDVNMDSLNLKRDRGGEGLITQAHLTCQSLRYC